MKGFLLGKAYYFESTCILILLENCFQQKLSYADISGLDLSLLFSMAMTLLSSILHIKNLKLNDYITSEFQNYPFESCICLCIAVKGKGFPCGAWFLHFDKNRSNILLCTLLGKAGQAISFWSHHYLKGSNCSMGSDFVIFQYVLIDVCE